MKRFCENLKHSILKTNQLFYAGAVVVTNRLEVKINKAAERKKQMWRLQNKIKELWKDRKYSIRVKTGGVIMEELKQRIVAIEAKFRKYQERVDRSRQNNVSK